ncbi:MAG: hypothetical protein GY830_06650 [Bacteroidetes bacterium]|jgi:hypothetical protein|nr:hypothetical protein [Bacteroidota bacterium]
MMEFRPVPLLPDKVPEGYKYNRNDELVVDQLSALMDEQDQLRDDWVRAGGTVKDRDVINAINDRKKLLAMKAAIKAQR